MDRRRPMTRRIRLPQSHFRRNGPDALGLVPIKAWPRANQGFYDDFRAWLRAGGYGASALSCTAWPAAWHWDC
ncbi:MAG: hypothetical protein P8186_16510 [Anaerolineae bacterium]